MVVTPSPRGDTLAARLLLEAHGRRLLREGLEADARGRAPHQLQLLRAPLPLLLLLLLLLLLRLRGKRQRSVRSVRDRRLWHALTAVP